MILFFINKTLAKNFFADRNVYSQQARRCRRQISNLQKCFCVTCAKKDLLRNQTTFAPVIMYRSQSNKGSLRSPF
jgi:hypothetical protein